MLKNIFHIGVLLSSFSLLTAQPLINLKLGGKQDEVAYSAMQTPLGDYVVAGSSASNNSGSSDIWITRRDKNGEKVWEKYFGGASHDIAYDIIQTKEGKYVACGFTSDSDPKVKTNKAIVICLSPKGDIEWQNTYGGGKGEKAACIVQTPDGGYLFTGLTRSFAKGQQDAWVVRLDATGKVKWQKSYGGLGTEDANAIVASRFGGYIIAGRVDIKGANDEKPNKNIYILKIDEAGKEIWSKSIAGEKSEEATSLTELPDGRIAVAGWTSSKGMGKTDGEIIFMNKDGNVLWDKTFGKAGIDGFNSITYTPDGNYLVAAGATIPASGSESGLWVMKIDIKGNILWEKTSNGDRDEQINSICPLTGKDGGFLLAGFSNNESNGGKDMWLLNISQQGIYKINQPAPPKPPVVIAPNPTEKPGKSDPMKPNLYILTVGVSNYSESKYNLTFAHTDADSIADMFATMRGKIFGKVEVKKLLNEQATLVNVKKAIQWLEEQATQKDLVIMFFSSHGALDNKGNLYILPTDFSPVSLFATGLNIKDITNGINGTPCKKLIFMDACHSGEAGADMLEFASIKDASTDNLMKEITDADPGVTIMSSSTGKEFSYEKPSWGHGAFTKAILEGLGGKADYNKDKTIYFSELNNYVSERVKELTKGKQHPFTPINIFGNIPIFTIQP